jgi:hypothetical protein
MMPAPCSSCGASDRTVMVGMAPGRDKQPWSLCVGCRFGEGVGAPQNAPVVARPVVAGGAEQLVLGQAEAKGTR